jgi:hypothetical protein
MKNANGEEINEALFNKKASEKLNEINVMLEDGIDDSSRITDILKSVAEYGMIMYNYGAFMHGGSK